MLEPEGAETTVEHLHPKVKELLDPKQATLLVIDKQRSYGDPDAVLPRLLNTNTDALQELVPRLDKFINTAREDGVQIIWTRMGEDPNLMTENFKLKMEIDDTPAISVPGTPDYNYQGEGPRPGEKEIDKVTYDAFTNTGLDEHLREKGLRTLVLSGAYGSRCVLATAFEASRRGFNVVLVGDLIANLKLDEQEIAAAKSIVNAILGFTLPSATIEKVWDEYKQKSAHS